MAVREVTSPDGGSRAGGAVNGSGILDFEDLLQEKVM
jgi:hypothetical protein